MEEYYKILGLDPSSSMEEIKNKYKELLLEFDPNSQDEGLREFFKGEQDKITEAYTKILENIIESNSNKEHKSNEVDALINNVENSDSISDNTENYTQEKIESSLETFGLEEGVSLIEVEEKYKLLISEFNPDNQSDNIKDFFIEETEKVNKAYEILVKYLSNDQILNVDMNEDADENEDEETTSINNQVKPTDEIFESGTVRPMFFKVFSFKGRIRRTEYGLSYIIFIIVFGLLLSWFEEANIEGEGIILIIPLFWFIITANVKRCHDMNLSGWMSIIPIFNPLVLIFGSGQSGDNDYGPNPKGLN